MTIDPLELARALGRPEPTAEQCAVIAAPLEPTLVIAGAGSGKTETIAARVVYLAANGLADPGQVLGLTFTRKAASELAERIRSRLRSLASLGLADRALAVPVARSQDGAEPLIGTYHSFAGRVIDEFGPLAGIEPAARVLTATATWQLARGIVSRWDKDLDTDHAPERVTEDLLAMSSALGDHLVSAEALDAELAKIVETLTNAPPSKGQRAEIHSGLQQPVASLSYRRSLVPMLRAFWQAKRDLRVVDFADQMQLAARIVESSGTVGASLRARHGIVLLDEYQDTGHAQRVILRGLFGGAVTGGATAGDASPRGHCVTAVGDPVQSIYGWRGASASNLLHFTTDFRRADGSPATTRPLLVSFRNDRRILDIANAVSAAVRRGPVDVGELRPSVAVQPGAVTSALLGTVSAEDEWLARTFSELRSGSGAELTMAVLVRRRSAMAGIAAALRARGLPVDVVGVGGLVDEPEVADVIAMLRLTVDHQSGPAAVRLLTGARWRLGIADLAALSRRAHRLRVAVPADLPGGAADAGAADSALSAIRHALAGAVGGEDVDEAGLVDAIADPGERGDYSDVGWRRIVALQGELRWLRTRLTLPLGELVADIERVLGLDVEVLLAPDGRAHLDEFEDVVAEVAAAGAGPIELLDYLATAGDREDGLPPGATQAPPGLVQVLTVHSAKGLEWDVVAVPHLSDGVFPNDTATSWLGDAAYLPPALRGDRADVPALDLPTGADQKELADVLAVHRASWRQVQLAEERRLFYVAVTRARHRLVLSAHHWSATRTTPSGPGQFLAELAGHPDSPLGEPSVWTDSPADGATNPLLDHPVVEQWPVDPLGTRRRSLQWGADLVRSASAARDPAANGAGAAALTEDRLSDPESATGLARADGADEPARAINGAAAERSTESDGVEARDGHAVSNGWRTGSESDPDGWERDIDLLLAERAAAAHTPATVVVPLPSSLSVSALVTMADNPERLARALHRPMPQPPAPQARRGTAFHAWLERRFGGEALLDIDDLPGARDEDAATDERLDDLVAAFLASSWADRTPIAVEVPFVTPIAGLTIRGRMDAVFEEPDGSALIVDWKTGEVPTGERARAAAMQLTAYRLAWSRLRDLPLDHVRAAFYYVMAGRTVVPENLMDAADVERLIARSTREAAGAAVAMPIVLPAPAAGPWSTDTAPTLGL